MVSSCAERFAQKVITKLNIANRFIKQKVTSFILCKNNGTKRLITALVEVLFTVCCLGYHPIILLSKNMKIAIVTQEKWLTRNRNNKYDENVWFEDDLVVKAFAEIGVKSQRVSWDDPDYNWGKVDAIVLRAVWDCFERFQEFQDWLVKVKNETILINSWDVIQNNLDKRYLSELEKKGITIPATRFIDQNTELGLSHFVNQFGWKEFILKPVFSSTARHTYRFKRDEVLKFVPLFNELIKNESMMLQEFQSDILVNGETSLMFFSGVFSHAVIKKGKEGDFRVQDDFGGTVETVQPTKEAIAFAEKCIAACDELPVYARVDIFKDNKDDYCLGELELIEPELWFRLNEKSAYKFAKSVLKKITSLKI